MVQIDKTCLMARKRLLESGAHDRSRTDDLTLTKGVLYQLSYMGNYFNI